jgi:membrane-bound lytic murein transglycosylase MltF
VGNLTVTEERKELVDFAVAKDIKPILELVVSGPNAPEVKSLEDLAGKTVHVRPSSSYAESLAALNTKLKAAGKQPVKIVALPNALGDEDALEMLNAGLFEFGVVDDWKGRMWVQVLKKIKLREDLVLRDEGVISWAIRKNSPKLESEILAFFANYKKMQGSLDSRLAQCVIGVMQLMPATGQELKVGDIALIEPNIHGGAKYMDQLMTRDFPDASFGEADRSLFAFAAYNAGPGNISRMGKEAAKRGLDENKWFDNVEVVTAEKIGLETTTYVRNIYKYYVAYRLASDARTAAEQARAQLAPGTKERVSGFGCETRSRIA